MTPERHAAWVAEINVRELVISIYEIAFLGLIGIVIAIDMFEKRLSLSSVIAAGLALFHFSGYATPPPNSCQIIFDEGPWIEYFGVGLIIGAFLLLWRAYQFYYRLALKDAP